MLPFTRNAIVLRRRSRRALDESQFEKYVIQRRNRHNSDLFRALCKGSGPDTCVHCVNFNAFPGNGGCSCPSDRATFLPVSRSCVNASTAVNTDFAKCSGYFKGWSFFFDSFNLDVASSASLYGSGFKSCTVDEQTAAYYNYSSQNQWVTFAGNIFSFERDDSAINFKWQQNKNRNLSGRIIRLNVTCTAASQNSQTTACLIFKAKGTITYNLNSGLISSTSSSSLPHLEASSVLPSLSKTVAVWSTSALLTLPTKSISTLIAPTSGRSLVLSKEKTSRVKPTESSTAAVGSSSSAGDDGPGDSKARRGGDNNGVVIGAAVSGTFVLGIFVIIIIVFCKRRKEWKSTEKQTKQGKNPVYGTSDNDIQLERPKESQTMPSSAHKNQPTYQGLISSNGQSNGTAIYSSPEDEYDNCTVYQSLEKPRSGTPVYQSLKEGQAGPAHTSGISNLKPKPHHATPNATGTKNPKRNGATGMPNLKRNSATGVPKPKPGAKGQPSQRSIVSPEPVYNVLDGPGSEQGTTLEPLYNVREGPDTGQDYEATNVDPLYNVLEGPNTTYDSAEIVLESNGAQIGPISGQSPDGDPLYNVLEGPESDQRSLERGPSTAQEPLYNVLEGPDAEKSRLVDHCGTVNEPLYNVLEGPDSGGSNQHAPDKPRPLSGHDNLAYEQTLEMNVPNAAVHRPGTQRESVYEDLRGPTQDLYEALGQSGDPHSTC